MTDNVTTETPEKGVAHLSQVTPKSSNRKLKEKALFAALLAGCAVIALVSFLPSRHKTLVENRDTSSSIPGNTLAQNLKLMAEMKEKSVELQKALQRPVLDGHHPPVLRTTSKHQPKLSAEILARMNAPSTFTLEASGSTTGSSNPATASTNTTLTANNANASFINQQDDIVSVSAKKLPHPALTIPAGEMIPATLETAINSELPGMVRAITTRDVYSLEGGNLLIPKASTLVGQFNASVTQGQSRLFIVWNRVQMSNGVIVTLNSPGTDTLGRSGQGADSIDRHFFERFGTGALLSMMGAYTANSGVNGQTEYNSESQYRSGIAESFQKASSQTLEEDMKIKPTLHINQGTPINVFVAHDLDFNGVGAVRDVATHNGWGGLWKK